MVGNDDVVSAHSDGELVKAVQQGNKKAFEELVSHYYKPLFGYIYLRTRNWHSSEDITQEVFLRAYRSIRKCIQGEGFADWLFRIAQNCYLEWARTRAKSPKVSDELVRFAAPPVQANPTSVSGESDISDQSLSRALKELPSSYWLIVSLKYQQGLSCREIAHRLEMPLGTVTSTLARAYKLLRSRIEKPE